ncbi:MAG: tRNA (adenosine(37)-N6)-threonylcarbamoyltransferase complex ATPase subunit type 1 TsaE [Proteobacteria bacterium]|nr:tRNA (adenosine(37)-N6)-threonylcarbamoyltransferase complex ATPase subunit type 1 TsaE [Pseudomonadota bacterium]
MNDKNTMLNGIYKNLIEEDLKKVAKNSALSISAPCVICLKGDLGAGKTTFSRAFIQTLLNDPEHIVPSPTFTIVQEYENANLPLYHFDLYRLSSIDDLIELNFEEAIHSGICLIEWPDIAYPLIKQVIHRTFQILKEDESLRTLKIF